MNGRQRAILDLVLKNSKINVNELSEKFKVSQVTIRQDLKLLEEEGMLKRVHGGAVPVSDDDIMKRMSYKYEEKLKIAKEAASMVNDYETVIIESGSTNALLAKELTNKNGITIITNSTFICRYIRGMGNIKVVLIGGDYQHESEVLVGPLTRICLKHFHVDKVFVGIDGYSKETGFTCINLMRAEVVRAMAEQANKIIVVTDSSKFDKVGVARQFESREVDTVITDSGISKKHLETLKSFNINVRIV